MKQHKFKIKVNPQVIVPNHTLRQYYYINLILISIMFGASGWLIDKLPKMIPLFFTMPWGIERLAPKVYLLMLPLIALTIMVGNILLTKIISLNNKKIFSYVLGLGSLIVTISLLIGMIGIVESIL